MPKPLEVLSDSHVKGFRYERTEPDGEGGVRGTREIREIPVQAVYRAVGYFGTALRGIPFDSRRGIIPNHEGQVMDDDNQRVPGVTPRVDQARARGPHRPHQERRDGNHPTRRKRSSLSWWSPEFPEEGSVSALLESRGVHFTNLDGWHRLDDRELSIGAERGRERVKVVAREEMMAASRGDSH